MKRSTRKTNTFLIHAHTDKETVYKLYQRLVNDGINAWLDVERLQPGQNWQNEIRNALFKCDVVLVCLSCGFDKQKGYRHEELKLALEKADFLPNGEIFIIPVRLEKCDIPESLHHLHRVDLFRPGGYKKLVGVLLKKQG